MGDQDSYEGGKYRQHRQHRLRPYWAPAGGREPGRQLSSQTGYAGPQGCCSESAPDPLSLTLLTVLTVFSGHERIRITLLPARPSRLNAISMPSARRNVCARRKWPARARGFFGQPVPSLGIRSLLRSTLTRRRSAALPVQELRSLMNSRTQAAIGSASIMPSIAALRLAVGASESTGGPQACFAGRGPEREVGHARQPAEVNGTHRS